MPTEKMCTVIETIAENRRRYEEFCYALSEEQLNRPVPESTWIVRDFAAHLGTLDVALIGWFGAAATGGQTDSSRIDGKAFDVDAFNDAEVASRRAWPLQDVFAEAAKNRVGLVRVLESLTDEQIDRSMHFAGDSKRPGADFPLKLFLAG